MLRIEVPPIESRAHIVTSDVSVSADSGAAKKRGDGGRSSVFGAGPQYQSPSHVTSQKASPFLECSNPTRSRRELKLILRAQPSPGRVHVHAGHLTSELQSGAERMPVLLRLPLAVAIFLDTSGCRPILPHWTEAMASLERFRVPLASNPPITAFQQASLVSSS